VRFFFDNNISQRIVTALQALDDRSNAPELVHLRARFPGGATDPVWIRELAREAGWIIISGDPRISRGAAERAAWEESGLTSFFLGDAWASRRLHVQASELIAVWPNVIREAKQAKRGTGFLIQPGVRTIRKIYPV
jgi:hypothetical protein